MASDVLRKASGPSSPDRQLSRGLQLRRISMTTTSANFQPLFERWNPGLGCRSKTQIENSQDTTYKILERQFLDETRPRSQEYHQVNRRKIVLVTTKEVKFPQIALDRVETTLHRAQLWKIRMSHREHANSRGTRIQATKITHAAVSQNNEQRRAEHRSTIVRPYTLDVRKAIHSYHSAQRRKYEHDTCPAGARDSPERKQRLISITSSPQTQAEKDPSVLTLNKSARNQLQKVRFIKDGDASQDHKDICKPNPAEEQPCSDNDDDQTPHTPISVEFEHSSTCDSIRWSTRKRLSSARSPRIGLRTKHYTAVRRKLFSQPKSSVSQPMHSAVQKRSSAAQCAHQDSARSERMVYRVLPEALHELTLPSQRAAALMSALAEL